MSHLDVQQYSFCQKPGYSRVSGYSVLHHGSRGDGNLSSHNNIPWVVFRTKSPGNPFQTMHSFSHLTPHRPAPGRPPKLAENTREYSVCLPPTVASTRWPQVLGGVHLWWKQRRRADSRQQTAVTAIFFSRLLQYVYFIYL